MLKTLSLCAALAIPQVSRADNARLYTVTEEVRGDVTFLITTAPGSEPLWGKELILRKTVSQVIPIHVFVLFQVIGIPLKDV